MKKGKRLSAGRLLGVGALASSVIGGTFLAFTQSGYAANIKPIYQYLGSYGQTNGVPDHLEQEVYAGGNFWITDRSTTNPSIIEISGTTNVALGAISFPGKQLQDSASINSGGWAGDFVAINDLAPSSGGCQLVLVNPSKVAINTSFPTSSAGITCLNVPNATVGNVTYSSTDRFGSNMAVDSKGNIWALDVSANSVVEFVGTGSNYVVETYPLGALGSAYGSMTVGPAFADGTPPTGGLLPIGPMEVYITITHNGTRYVDQLRADPGIPSTISQGEGILGSVALDDYFLPTPGGSYNPLWELTYINGDVWFTDKIVGTVNKIVPFNPSHLSVAYPVPPVPNQGVASPAARPEGYGYDPSNSEIYYWEVPLIQNSSISSFNPGAIGYFSPTDPSSQFQYDVVLPSNGLVGAAPAAGPTINEPDDMLAEFGAPLIVIPGSPPVPTTTTTVAATTTTVAATTTSTAVPVTQPSSGPTTTTIPATTTSTAVPVTQPSSGPTTTVGSVASGSSASTAVLASTTTAAATSITVPSTHTGEPWSSSIWWALVAASGIGGVILLLPRRKHGTSSN